MKNLFKLIEHLLIPSSEVIKRLESLESRCKSAGIKNIRSKTINQLRKELNEK